VERAGAGGGATADAGIIYYGGDYALMRPDDGPEGFDLPYYILAHEVAHQWWGMARLTPANVEGAGVLIEGLAVYSGMQVLKASYGDRHLRQYADYLHASYAMPRSLASPPLLQANDDFLYYRKAGIALYALSRYIGTEKVNGALRQFFQKRVSGEIPLPTTLDLYRQLQRATPDSLRYLLHDLFETNTYWRLSTKRIAAVPAKAGRWRVTLEVQAEKVVVQPTGQEKQVPMNDWLELGLYEAGKGLHEPLYLRKHRIRSGRQTVTVTVSRKPDRGGIDPDHLMIDLRADDNIKEVKPER
jgi:ABC-2 type transport system permease protein